MDKGRGLGATQPLGCRDGGVREQALTLDLGQPLPFVDRDGYASPN